MREKTNNTGESAAIQNQFTAYLLTALRRRKIQYRQALVRKTQHEQFQDIGEEAADCFSVEPDMMQGLPFLDQIENERLRQALMWTREQDLTIFIAKALEGRSFAAIAKDAGMKYNTVASLYYRLVSRLIKAMGGDGR